MSKIEKAIHECHLNIRAGKLHRAREIISHFPLKKIPREYRARVANLYMRMGQSDLSLQILNRIVRAKGASPIVATSEETKEYGAALVAMGMPDEAIDLLRNLDPDVTPDANLYIAIGYFTKWDYAAAIPFLESFIQNDNISDYQLQIGRVNLLSAYVTEGYLEAANQLCEKLLKELSALGHRLLLSNVIELQVQMAIKEQNFLRAEQSIAHAYEYQGTGDTLSHLYLEKWRAVNLAQNLTYRSQGIAALREVADRARRLMHWETLRECQYFLSKTLEDDYAFFRVYFGTPHIAYRRRMLYEFGSAPNVPNHFVLHQLGSITDYPLVFDFQSGQLEGENVFLKYSGLPFQLLCLLASDFFSPFRVAEIFSRLFPNEYFDPFSSPHRIHSLVNRLRKELERKNIPLEIRSDSHAYQLKITGPIALKVYLENFRGSKVELQWNRFCMKFLKELSFSREDLMSELGVSYRTASRILKWANQEQKIKSIEGKGENRYHIV